MGQINRYNNNDHEKIVWTYSLLLGELMSKLSYNSGIIKYSITR